LNNIATKISLFILIVTLILSCNVIKKVPEGKHLLIKNEILVNDKKNISDEIVAQLIQQPNNPLIFGYKLRLNMYNLAKENTDSIYKAKFIANPNKYKRMSKWLSKKQVDRLGNSFWYSGWHSFLKKTGEPPVIINELKAKKSAKQLKAYYFNHGYFNADAKFNIDYKKNKRGSINYNITTGTATFLDTISHEIETKALDSLYLLTRSKSLIKKGKQYNVENFDSERNRITSYYRDHGVYYFQQQNINFEIDTLSPDFKAPVILKITNQVVKEGDSTITKPYKIYRIGEVNIFINNSVTKNKRKFADSATYKKFNLYSTDKLKYRPKAITNAVFIQKDSLFSDTKRALTLRLLSNLRIFDYPKIQFKEDSITQTLKTNIYLTEKDKFSFKPSFDATHSNIQNVGIAGTASLSIRNVFRGAEILEIGLRGNLGSSKNFANPDNQFFNVSEYGADMRLSFPRLLFPIKTERIIPKTMFASTLITSGFAKQKNIGLDKENFTAAFNYNWIPAKNTTAKFDLLNLQYVKNINTSNYFRVYRSSYDLLNQLAKTYNTDPSLLDESGNLSINEGGADAFISNSVNNNYPLLNFFNKDYKTIKSIQERKIRLTENNLILATNFNYLKDSKVDLFDKEFYSFRGKIELAGNVFSLIANLSNTPRNEDGSRNIFGLQYSQYVKTEFDYVKHWDLLNGKVFAMRSFFGIAIPYGNSKSIPFSRSYFAGGSNDNRGWQSYGLGPGNSKETNDFNEANMKFALSAEFRFKLFGSLNSAFFSDLGNIWNVLDSEKDETKIFSGIRSLQSLALGTGIGLRYDLKFFLIRLDVGFKTYNPASDEGQRWFKEYNWSESVIHFGINYPF
jgi:outer membrane protein assembly factor BamA